MESIEEVFGHLPTVKRNANEYIENDVAYIEAKSNGLYLLLPYE